MYVINCFPIIVDVSLSVDQRLVQSGSRNICPLKEENLSTEARGMRIQWQSDHVTKLHVKPLIT